MRSGLTFGFALLVVGTGIAVSEGCSMAEKISAPLRVTMKAPGRVDRAVLLGDKALPTVDALEVSVWFENIGERPVSAPVTEIANGLIIAYRVGDGLEMFDDAVPPPPQDGEIMTLAPGEAHVERLMLEPPDSMIGSGDEPVDLKVCVRWKADWLRTKNYASGTVTWNPDIDLCAITHVYPPEE